MEVPGLSHLRDLCPLVLRYFVHLTFLRCLVWVLRSNGKQEVLRTIFESLMQVGQLVSRASVNHWRPALCLISLLVNHEAIVCYNCANFVFFLFTANTEDFAVYLDARKVFWKNLCVAQTDLHCCLRCKIVNH